MIRERIPEHVVPGRRLGRHVVHDPRSRDYAVRAASPLRDVLHKRLVPIYDQGNLGCCTSEAICGGVCTRPLGHHIRSQRTVKAVYHQETVLDGYAGTWPPDDTGSSSLAAFKAAQARGWISGYRWAFSLNDALAALMDGPAIAGIAWREGCDNPDSTGLVRYTGSVRGGHEICAVGVDVEAKRVRFANSWGDGWGDHGYFDMAFDDLATALADQGDFGQPVR